MNPAPVPPRAVFLDRDGTIIEDRHYLADPAGVALLPGAGEALGRLCAAGCGLFVVTNQSGIGRGTSGRKIFWPVRTGWRSCCVLSARPLPPSGIARTSLPRAAPAASRGQACGRACAPRMA